MLQFAAQHSPHASEQQIDAIQSGCPGLPPCLPLWHQVASGATGDGGGGDGGDDGGGGDGGGGDGGGDGDGGRRGGEDGTKRTTLVFMW